MAKLKYPSLYIVTSSILPLFFPTVSAQCGSLVTYRQHADLLQNAPQCLRDGCNKGQNVSTISSQCPSSSPCYIYWNMFVEQFDQKHAWCTSCSSDLACRIPGWPVMNATAVCGSTPNQLLFGGEGCCTQGDEPFQLAEWTGKLCNESEWREPFDKCGGMACLDWREWIMPWNWTVRNELLPPDQQHCTAPSKYLAIYGAEHFFWLFFSIAVGGFRLWIAHHEEKHERNVLRYFFLSAWTGFTKKFKQRRNTVLDENDSIHGGEHLRPAFTDKLRWGFPVFMGIFLAGMQLGFNFLAAHLIQRQPGYHNVPLGLLALLFCCRPRLSWLSCLLAQVPETWLIKIFNFKPNGDGLWAAKLVLSSVAVTSAVTEAIMQILGAYFMGRTAQIGTERGFYYIHHLRPKMHGRDARHMYFGALFWVMLCIPLVVIWFLVALFFAQIFDAVSSWRRGIFHFLNPKTKKMPELTQGPVHWLLDHINPDTAPPESEADLNEKMDDEDQVMRHDSDQPLRVDHNSWHDQPIPVPYGGPGSSDLFNDQPIPVRQTSASRRSHYSRLSQSDFEDQIMPVPRAASATYRHPSAGYTHTHTGVQRRTPSGSQYNALSQHDAVDDEDQDQILPVPRHQQPHPRPRPHRAHNDESQNSLLAPYQRPVSPRPSTGNTSSTPRRDDYTQGVSWKWADWERKIIFAGTVLGMLAYASQWLFWDGFVKAAGDRFCPPKVVDVGAIWWGGSLLYVGAPFLGY